MFARRDEVLAPPIGATLAGHTCCAVEGDGMVFLGGQQAKDAVEPITRVLEKELMAVQSTQIEQSASAGRTRGRGWEVVLRCCYCDFPLIYVLWSVKGLQRSRGWPRQRAHIDRHCTGTGRHIPPS